MSQFYMFIITPHVQEPMETQEAAPVPTYDQQFPSLGGGAGAGPGAAAAPAPFGSWNVKPRVQSSTITQVRVFVREIFIITATSYLNDNHDYSPLFLFPMSYKVCLRQEKNIHFDDDRCVIKR